MIEQERTMNVRSMLVAVGMIAMVIPATLMAAPAGADDRVVRIGPADNIQAALDAAGSGATIKLLPGRYEQTFTITGNDVTLRGSGPETVVAWPDVIPGPTSCPSAVIACATGDRD